MSNENTWHYAFGVIAGLTVSVIMLAAFMVTQSVTMTALGSLVLLVVVLFLVYLTVRNVQQYGYRAWNSYANHSTSIKERRQEEADRAWDDL